jgi:small-conductance mechanosensitive channel
VTVAIYDEFQKAGIEIPFPQQDLHVRSVDPYVKEIFTEKKTKTIRKTKTD